MRAEMRSPKCTTQIELVANVLLTN
jgi:hypothetical protein